MQLVFLAGSPNLQSRSSVLLNYVKNAFINKNAGVQSFAISDFSAEDLISANFNSPALKRLQQALNEADALVVATPVYKASFAGTLKTVLDLLAERSLEGKHVLPIATGGSAHHLLAVDYALKPVISSLKAQEILNGIFAVDAQVAYAKQDQPEFIDDLIKQRLDESIDYLYAALVRKPQPIIGQELQERLIAAQLSY